MNSPNATNDAAGPPADHGSGVSRGRWRAHLALLLSYPLALGVLSWWVGNQKKTPLLPANTRDLLWTTGVELAIFGLVFGCAWLASRATARQLRLNGNGGVRPVFRGLGYSIMLRVGIGLAVLFFVLVVSLVGGDPGRIAEKIRPRTELVVDPRVIARDPAYFWLLLTVVSFVLGGFREELWRSGVLAGLAALFPEQFRTFRGKSAAILLAAAIFGLGHLPQGWGGVAITALLGLGLGAVMVHHGSIWEAVFAHGFFDATTFTLLAFLASRHPEILPNS